MKKRFVILTNIILAFAAGSTTAQSGGGYAITQSVIAAGGGQNSTGGNYSFAGTIGQAIAGQPANGSTYNLTAGFWTPTNIAPTAAGASVGGRVITAAGVGIRNVIVTLTGANGEQRTTSSGAGGYFIFADVPSGEIYTVSVAAKRYRFAQSSQILSVIGDIENLLFVSDSSVYLPPTTPILKEPLN